MRFLITNTKMKVWLISIICLTAMLSCTGQPTNESTVAVDVTSATVTITAIPSPKPVSPTPIPIATATPTASATVIPTSTPLPTLPLADRREIVDALIQTNGGCQLPCWWGFTPGQTPWTEIEATLSRLTGQIFLGQSKRTYTVRFRELSETGQDDIPRQIYTVENDRILTITTTAPNTTTYNIAQVLSTYQTPDEIWVYSLPDLNDGSQAFFLALLYQKKGFLVTYPYYHPFIHEPILGCYTTISFPPRLIMWPSSESLTFQEAALEDWYDKDSIPDFQPLAKATNMDILTFVETFQDPNNTACLETEAEFWYEVFGY